MNEGHLSVPVCVCVTAFAPALSPSLLSHLSSSLRPGRLRSPASPLLPRHRRHSHVFRSRSARQPREHPRKVGPRSPTFLPQRSIPPDCHQERLAKRPGHQIFDGSRQARDNPHGARPDDVREGRSVCLPGVLRKDTGGSSGSFRRSDSRSSCQAQQDKKRLHFTLERIRSCHHFVVLVVPAGYAECVLCPQIVCACVCHSTGIWCFCMFVGLHDRIQVGIILLGHHSVTSCVHYIIYHAV